MANKKLIFFTASTMIAAGFTLASNVSLAERVGKFLSETFQFEGPISGLVNALVRSHDKAGERPVISFQVQGKDIQSNAGAVAASSSAGIPIGNGAISVASNAAAGGSAVVNSDVRKDQIATNRAPYGTGLIAFGGALPNDAPLQSRRIIKGMGSMDVTALLTNPERPDGFNGKLRFDSLPLAGAVEIPALASTDQGEGELPMILASVTSNDVAGGVAASTTQASVVPSSTTRASDVGFVPLPGSLALIGLGLAGLLGMRRNTLK